MVEKAEIIVLTREGKMDKKIPVMFNPKEYSVLSEAAVSGEGANLQFQKVNVQDFTVPLFFDTYEKQTDVRDKTRDVTSLLMPTVEGKDTKQPPVCLFSWGRFTYKGIIIKIDQKFTMFLDTGIPVRSALTVTFKSVITTEEDAKFKGKEACRKVWTVKSGERLDLIAYSTLKDVNLWRKIAKENNIDNPREFPKADDIGRILIIPE